MSWIAFTGSRKLISTSRIVGERPTRNFASCGAPRRAAPRVTDPQAKRRSLRFLEHLFRRHKARALHRAQDVRIAEAHGGAGESFAQRGLERVDGFARRSADRGEIDIARLARALIDDSHKDAALEKDFVREGRRHPERGEEYLSDLPLEIGFRVSFRLFDPLVDVDGTAFDFDRIRH